MLMVAILSWGKDLVFQPAYSIDEIHELKRRLNLSNTDYIIHDSNFLCPIKMDCATRELTESEQIEWLQEEVYPALLKEGLIVKKRNGKFTKAKPNEAL